MENPHYTFVFFMVFENLDELSFMMVLDWFHIFFVCRSNININDILGDYSLTLIDVLDTLVILGDVEEFRRAVQLVVDNVNFDKNSTVQVFEANIRYFYFNFQKLLLMSNILL